MTQRNRFYLSLRHWADLTASPSPPQRQGTAWGKALHRTGGGGAGALGVAAGLHIQHAKNTHTHIKPKTKAEKSNARPAPLPPKHRSRPSRAGSSGLRRFHFHRSPPPHLSCGLLTSRPPNGMYSAERLPWSIASGAKFVELLGGGD